MKRRATAAAVKRSTPVAKYDAAGMGRRIASWNPPSSGPNKSIEGLQKIRNRARDATRNDWAASSAVQKWTTNLVGTGITPRWKKPAITDLWAKHARTCDADGVLDAYGMQALGVRTWFDGGEVFLRRRPRDLSLPLPVPVQYQLIEGDFVPLWDADAHQDMPKGNQIRQGIELNKYGRRVAYWMYKEHPGDRTTSVDPRLLVRVPAGEVSHIYEVKRPGQLRGVSELASVLIRLRNAGDLEDAVLDRQKLANLFTAFITRPMPDAADVEWDQDTGLPKFYNKEGTPVAHLEPGIAQELQPGEGVTFANPPEAGTTFSEYMRTTHLGTAAGGGLPYEIMSGDIQNVSDRTLRVVITEFRRLAQQRQWHTIIPRICQPMVDWFADAAALSGAISLSDLDEAKSPKWSPQGWEYIHPVQDAQGKVALIEGGIVSRSSVIGERGDDPDTVDAERAADKKREDRLGLTPPPEPVKPGPAPAPGAPKPTPKQLALEDLEIRRVTAEVVALERPPVAPAPAEPSAIERALAGMSAIFAQQQEHSSKVTEAFLAVTKALAEREVVVNTGDVHVDNQVNPTPVVNQVDVPATVVNVAPAPVSVAAPVVSIVNEVQPATVEVSVDLPERKTVSDIDRDRDGNITKVVQVETTVPPKKKKD